METVEIALQDYNRANALGEISTEQLEFHHNRANALGENSTNMYRDWIRNRIE